MGQGALNTMLESWFSGLLFPPSSFWVRGLHLPTHLHYFTSPVSSYLPSPLSLSITSLLLLSCMTSSKLLKLSKPVFTFC